MKAIYIIFVLLFVVCLGNPLAVAGANPTPPEPSSSTTNSLNLLQDFNANITHIQKQLKLKMTELSRSLQQGDRAVIAWLLGLAFLYGVVHSAGPGHGKSVIVSYLLTQGGHPRRGIFLGAVAALLHGLSAIILVLLIYYLSLGRLTRTFSEWGTQLQSISYGLISLIGLSLLIIKTASLCQKKSRISTAFHKSDRSWWVFLALGLVPCPGTMIIMLFFLSMKMIGFGVLMAVAMAAGMAVTLSVVGFVAMLAKQTIDRQSMGEPHPVFTLAQNAVEFLGAGLVLAIGLLMLYSTTV
jgi:ABC-type nickel/cobalt efflux system permease component RcnA